MEYSNYLDIDSIFNNTSQKFDSDNHDQNEFDNINDLNKSFDTESLKICFTDTKTKQNKVKKIGRKKIGEIYQAKHTKSSDDNKIRKIKTSLLGFLVKILNQSIKSSNGRFRPLDKKMKESLEKSENIKLLNSKIKFIFSNTKMDKVGEKKSESNKKLIEKIYEENIETETISILEKTFEEFLNETRDNNLETFLNIIKNKEIRIQNKNKENFDIEKYMKEVKILLFDYKGWFERKKERTKKNKNIENIFV